ncbi:MAG: hypothetical protein JJE51_10895 [Thermoanaerobaculia bacterium]|nr:hypothetical protein [Thermoanaerobaculia bacterium]
MRKSGILAVVVLTFVIGVSLTGQQVDLPVEPVRFSMSTTLAEAVRHNDFAAFDSMYLAALRRGEMVQEFADLHALWTWAMNDQTGAFYGVEKRAEFARAYPGYANFIDQFRIIDSNGNAFYPSAETRAFLLQQAEIGVIARVEPAPVPSVKPVIRETREPVQISQVAPIATPDVARALKPVSPLPVARTSQPVAPRITATIPEVREPAVLRARTTSGVARGTSPARVPEPAQTAIPPASAPNRSGLGRGIFLMIAGLLGIGMVTMMLQAPATRS